MPVWLDRRRSVPAGGAASGGTRPNPLRRELVVFLAVAALVLLAVAAGTVYLSGRVARETALDEAEDTAARIARVLVEPLLPQALAGDRATLDRVLRVRLEDGSVTSVVVWTPDGRVLYSSDPDMEGISMAPTPGLRAAAEGRIVSSVEREPGASSPSRPDGAFLDVYAPLTVDGEPLVVEANISASTIDGDAALLRDRVVPFVIGALVVLQLVQVPIAVSLGRRLSRQEDERKQLIERNLRASDRERRAIAADVHDGPVQQLAGVSYAFSGLRARLPEEHRASVDWLQRAHQSAVASLRFLMVGIHPPDLTGDGLPLAFEDLARGLRERGLTVVVSQDPDLPQLSSTRATILYRSGREALANVARHAEARNVWVRLEVAEQHARPAVRLTVSDDGVGFPDTDPGRAPAGHLGLRLVHDRITGNGGSVTLGNRPGGGAVLDIVLPLDDEH